ncbi:MAG: septal ring lytic transglycosylase RlpA family protein [Pseudomonadota bacterium]
MKPRFAAMRALATLTVGLVAVSCAHQTNAPSTVGKAPTLPPTPAPHEKVGSPYVIGGIRYVPRVDPHYDEIGIASWYGPKFHNKLTANGELFDMNRLTAAHKTLPLPSLVRVTNLENGRSAILRLNDRGPFAGNRVIDLSKKAAEVLGTQEQGLGKVRVEYLGKADLDDAIVALGQPEDYAALQPPGQLPPVIVAAAASPTPVGKAPLQPIVTATPVAPVTPTALSAPVALQPITPVKPRPSPQMEPIRVTYTKIEDLIPQAPSASQIAGYYVQVGVFQSAQNARTARDQLPMALPVRVDTDMRVGGDQLHHVRIGPYAHSFAAQEAKKVATNQGFTDAHVVRHGETD